jgi:hypothetical protein
MRKRVPSRSGPRSAENEGGEQLPSLSFCPFVPVSRLLSDKEKASLAAHAALGGREAVTLLSSSPRRCRQPLPFLPREPREQLSSLQTCVCSRSDKQQALIALRKLFVFMSDHRMEMWA